MPLCKVYGLAPDPGQDTSRDQPQLRKTNAARSGTLRARRHLRTSAAHARAARAIDEALPRAGEVSLAGWAHFVRRQVLLQSGQAESVLAPVHCWHLRQV